MPDTDTPDRFDPWPTCSDARPARTENPGDPATPPVGWHRLSDTTREILGGEAARLLAEHPERRRPADVAWLAARLRDRVRDVRPVEADLGSPEIVAHLMLNAIVRKFLVAGSLAANLRAQRDAIDATLAALERMAPPAPVTPAPAAEAPKAKGRGGLFRSASA